MSAKNSSEIWDLVEAKREAFFALSDRVWEMPELNFEEHRSCAEHATMLEQQGFRVTRGVAGMPTAVMGEAGEGGPVIAILGEYDALPGLSQQAGTAEQKPVVAGGNGHGCGHNLLGSGSLMAATAVKDYLAAHGLKGRVRYYGCPAEEGGSAKGFMVRAGVFDDVDIAISWHPAPFAGVNNPISLACNEINFHFSGRASHAAASPHLGRSALDAVELMNVGVNYMREHMPSTARIHYAVTDAGGVGAERGAGQRDGALSDPRPRPAGDAGPAAPGEEDRRGRGADDGNECAQRDRQRRCQSRRQHAARAADASEPRTARASGFRRAGPGLRRGDPEDADRRGYQIAPSPGSA